MSSYFRRLISRRIVDIVKSHIKYKLPNEEKLVKGFYQGIRIRVPSKPVQNINRSQFKFFVTNPETLKVSLPEDFRREDVARLQPRSLSDGLITGFSLSKPTRIGPLEILITVKEFEFKKHVLNQIWEERENYGYTSVRDEGNKQTVFIESVSTSRTHIGPFHCMDLYSAIIANVAANIYEAAGYKVIKCRFIRDRSTAFVCLCQWLEEKGNIEQVKQNPVSRIYEIYQQINRTYKTPTLKGEYAQKIKEKMKTEDKSVMVNVKNIRDIINTESKKMFGRLGIQFTHTEWESEYKYHRPFLMPVITLIDRYEKYKFDLMVYAGARPKTNEKIKFLNMQRERSQKPDPASSDLDQISSVRFLLIPLPLNIVNGQNKSIEEYINSIKQEVIIALESREESEKIEKIEQVAEVIGNTCIIVQTVLSTVSEHMYKRKGVYENIENGMFLQDVYARLDQMLRMNADVNIDELLEVSDDMVKRLEEPEAKILVSKMCQFEEIFQDTLIENQPAFIVQYLLDLGSCIIDCLDTLSIKNQPHDVVLARLALFTCAKTVFSNGFHLLGIKPLDKFESKAP